MTINPVECPISRLWNVIDLLAASRSKKYSSFIFRKYKNRIGFVSIVDEGPIGGVGERPGVRVCV